MVFYAKCKFTLNLFQAENELLNQILQFICRLAFFSLSFFALFRFKQKIVHDSGVV